MKQLFFDDGLLLVRENIKRRYGEPNLIKDSVFSDGICETPFCTGHIFEIDGEYRFIYFGVCDDGKRRVFCAKSEDGIHFVPKDVTGLVNVENPISNHQIMELKSGQEIAEIYEDNTASGGERYKLLMSTYKYEDLCVYDEIYTSSDLLNWNLKVDGKWGYGAEPITGVFYNYVKKCHTIITRPFWGIRKIGYIETNDFVNLSQYSYCLQQDALDEPLSEIYGMKVIAYDGLFIGLPQMYCKLKGCYSAKYFGGCEEAQLAYSADGQYWLRSLREPFISGTKDVEKLGYENKMVWISQIKKREDGNILIYTSATTNEHGTFSDGATGNIQVYELRKDGFIFIENDDKAKPSLIATREKIWNGKDVHINLNAKSATVAIYEAVSNVEVSGTNMLGVAEPVDGFTHEDCIEFSGDSTDWIPKFKSGKTLDEFKNRTIVIEIRFTDGKVYSIEGDYIDAYNTEAGRFRARGILPSSAV